MLIAALPTITKIWKQPKCPSIGEWIKKNWCICTIKYNLPIKKDWYLAIQNNMDGLWGCCAEWNVTEWKTNAIWLHLYVESKKQNKWLAEQKQTHRYRDILTVARWKGIEGRWVKKVKGFRNTNC